MKKQISAIIVIISMLLCTCFQLSIYAASSDKNAPTKLELNEEYKSNVYTNHPNDYYTFTLAAKTKIIIELSGVAMNHEYKMTLYGNNVNSEYTTQNIDDSMYIVKTLAAGIYYIDVESDFRARTEPDEINYSILVTDNKINTFQFERGRVDLDNIIVNDDFEDSNMNNWLDGFRPHFVYGNKAIEEDDNGKYLALTSADPSQYYIFEAKDTYSTSLLYSQFDIKFTSGDMQLQVRQASSNLDSDFKMAGRIRKTAYYLEYYSNGQWYKMLDKYNQWLKLKDVSKWYRIHMALDVRSNKYSIFIEDRDSDEIISSVESVSFAEPCTYISYYALSSNSKLCIDNVIIGNAPIDIRISRKTYVKIPSSGTQQYIYDITTLSNMRCTDILWGISNTNYVSIDSDTGILSVEESATPGPLLIYAYKKYYPWVKTTFLVDLER